MNFTVSYCCVLKINSFLFLLENFEICSYNSFAYSWRYIVKIQLQASHGSATEIRNWQCMKGRISTIPQSTRNHYVHSVEKYVIRDDSTSMGSAFVISWKIPKHLSKDVLMWPNPVNKPAPSQYPERKKDSEFFFFKAHCTLTRAWSHKTSYAQLSLCMKFILLTDTKIPTVFGILVLLAR